MRLHHPLVYEVEFDVPGQHREAYDTWLDVEVIHWITHDAVAEFRVYHNDQGLSPETKLVFEFESIETWTEFVSSDEHDRATAQLETLTDRLRATLWHRDSLNLDSASTTTQPDGGRLSNVSPPET